MSEQEQGNDAMLAAAGVTDADLMADANEAAALSDAEDKRVAETDEATHEPGEDYPPRPPAGLDADTGTDPPPSA